jgi:hypothetical protein
MFSLKGASKRKWEQDPVSPTAKRRDPVVGAFFNTQSVASIAAALVREGVGQNPLDAKRDGQTKVRIRVYVSGEEGALERDVASKYLGGLRGHLEKCDEDAAKRLEDNCPYLVIEDFNTVGLIGDVASNQLPAEDEDSHFYYFFRTEGSSAKSGSKVGRWGIGKFVFPMVSEINTFWGLTVREDDDTPGPLLMGQTVLKNHDIGPDCYSPDGSWAEGSDTGVPVPIEDRGEISEFCKDWNVSRKDEPGLSLVVPYVKEEISATDLIKAIVDEYYFPILNDMIEIEVASPDLTDPVVISQDTLSELIEEHESLWEDLKDFKDLKARIEAIAWRHSALANSSDADSLIELNVPDHYEKGSTPKLDQSWLNETDLNRLMKRLTEDKPTIVRVPVWVSRQDEKNETASYFDILYSPEKGVRTKPTYIRGGLVITGVNNEKISDHRCFVIVEEEELSQMVGDSEGPAHTEWSARNEKFSGKYRQGMGWLSLIKSAPAVILRIAEGQSDEKDEISLGEFFPRPVAVPYSPPDPVERETEDPEDPPPPTRKVKFVESRIKGGFAMSLENPKPSDFPMAASCTVGYARRKGDPFKKWKPLDFSLDSTDFAFEHEGVEDLIKKENELTFRVVDPDAFRMIVRGFDVNRDLRVSTRQRVGAKEK